MACALCAMVDASSPDALHRHGRMDNLDLPPALAGDRHDPDSLPVFDLEPALGESLPLPDVHTQRAAWITMPMLSQAACAIPSPSAHRAEARTLRTESPPSRAERRQGDGAARAALAAGVAECLRRTGCCVVRDPRVRAADNERFLDMMERYFSRPGDAKLDDCRPDLHYQVPRW